MRLFGRDHEHVKTTIGGGHPLAGKIVYIPRMAQGSSEVFAAVFRWLGIEAQATPPSNERTRELGAKHTNGDECYPAKVTVGDLVRVIEQPGFDAKRAVFFMPTADGPCRFGQYAPFLKRILTEMGYGEIEILSPTSRNSYGDLKDVAGRFLRGAWRAIVAADAVRKALLQTRPYEVMAGSADQAFEASIEDLANTIAGGCADAGCQLEAMVESLTRARRRFCRVATARERDLPLIGVVGEIFCRLNNFSNDDLVRKLESYGAEAWLSDIGEWVGYTNYEELRKLRLDGRVWTVDAAKAKLRHHVQHSDEHALLAPFSEEAGEREEPPMSEVLDLARPYLPEPGVLGEMVLSVGKAAYLAKHGADGVIDISPFTCMNGIVSEAIYPRLSRDHGGIPIRNFYFDGTQSDLDRDLGVYMELARSYREQRRGSERGRNQAASPRTAFSTS